MPFSSLYQIFVSEKNETADINRSYSYQRYSSSSPIYRLAATVGANETFPLQYFFINSEEEVKGLSGQFDTIGNYYLHIRAVILGEVRVNFHLFTFGCHDCCYSFYIICVDFFFRKLLLNYVPWFLVLWEKIESSIPSAQNRNSSCQISKKVKKESTVPLHCHNCSHQR